MDFASFRDFVLRSVEEIGAEFRDAMDDWESVFLGVDSAGEVQVIFSLSETGLLQDEAGKDQLAITVLPNLVRENCLVMYGLVASSTTYRLSDSDLRTYKKTLRVPSRSPVGAPETGEQIVVMIATRDRFEEYVADISRADGKPPRLSSWRLNPLGTSGRFVDHVRLALFEGGSKSGLQPGEET